MRKTFFVILFCLQSYLIHAQAYISANVGPALPVGEYGSTNLSNDAVGFADLGISASLKFTQWLANHKIGLMADVGMMRNPFDAERYESEFTGQVGTADVSISSNNYEVITAMPGILFGRYDEEHDSDVYGFVKLGIMSVTTPAAIISYGTNVETIESQSATGFGYGVGVGAHWTLVGKLGISGTVEYVGGTASLEGFDQPIGNLNALLGILLHF